MNDTNEIVTCSSNGPSVYKNGIWGEIISMPGIKIKEDYKYLIKLLKEHGIQ